MKTIVASILIAIFISLFMLPDPPEINNVTTLSISLQKWHKRGDYIEIEGHKLFYIYERCRRKSVQNPPTFVIIHGFPSSSYEYHKVIDKLLEYGDVFLHDHLGFGFSDKPKENFTYSMSEAAENSLTMWRKMGIKSAHVVSHDMGDTILTEILARRHRGLLPDDFKKFFVSATFTNGGMKYSLINLRLGQILLKNVNFGSYFTKLATRLHISQWFTTRQLQSIWGPNADPEERNRDIAAIEELNRFRGGSTILHKTIYYLWDRAHFEFRWFAALRHPDFRIRFVWGDSDAVAPKTIPEFFTTMIPGMELRYIRGAGHFIMLEKPDAWLEEVIKVL